MLGWCFSSHHFVIPWKLQYNVFYLDRIVAHSEDHKILRSSKTRIPKNKSTSRIKRSKWNDPPVSVSFVLCISFIWCVTLVLLLLGGFSVGLYMCFDSSAFD
mmetsp:Transcript_12520/g.16765  ORF Transcript_12520/g.16765 Transcript_12520/m.16765 type:complete len:102 (-) Transcript_12520:60-365(-)